MSLNIIIVLIAESKLVSTQNWSAIFDLTDPDDQLQNFNQITLWLLDLHAPLRSYVRRDPVNPWFIDIERAIIERNIAYRVWRGRKPAVDREKYKTLRKRVNNLTREAKHLYMKRYLDPNLPTKTLWRNLDSVGAKNATENELVFSPNQLNSFLTLSQLVGLLNFLI
jgi:hypothetical protein